jgi:hypothetical protein
LAIFAVNVAGSDDVDATDVATLDPARIEKLKAVFWDMNSLSSYVETINHPDSTLTTVWTIIGQKKSCISQ